MKNYFLILAIIFITLQSYQTYNHLTGKVIAIADGDTFTLLVDNLKYKIRLADIDAPEKNQPFGNISKQYLANLIFGKTVIVNWNDLDRNGRIIGEIELDNKNINEEMVKNGMAWQFLKYNNDEHYKALQQQAKNNKLGLWQDENAIAPWEFRKAMKENYSTH